jgi:hypothetical protein
VAILCNRSDCVAKVNRVEALEQLSNDFEGPACVWKEFL